MWEHRQAKHVRNNSIKGLPHIYFRICQGYVDMMRRNIRLALKILEQLYQFCDIKLFAKNTVISPWLCWLNNRKFGKTDIL